MSEELLEYETKPDPVQAEIEHTDEVLHNPGGLNAPIIAFVGLVGTVLVFVIMVATQAWYYSQQRNANETGEGAEPYAPVADYHTEQEALLNRESARWVEGPEEFELRISVPIDTAIEKFETDEKFRALSSGK